MYSLDFIPYPNSQFCRAAGILIEKSNTEMKALSEATLNTPS